MDIIERMNVELPDLENTSPNTSKIDLNRQTLEEKKSYLEKYSIYRTWFTEFIIRLLELDVFDKKIAESDLNFRPVSENKMDIYQFLTRDRLKFLYIRNNIYIEKLTEEERNFIGRFLSDTRLQYNDEIEQFVRETFHRIILENTTGRGEKTQVMFGPNSINYMVQNGSIVIGMRYDEWNMQGLSDDEWEQLDNKRKFEFLPDLFQGIQKSAITKKIPVYIIRYNDFSVTPRRIENRNQGGKVDYERN